MNSNFIKKIWINDASNIISGRGQPSENKIPPLFNYIPDESLPPRPCFSSARSMFQPKENNCRKIVSKIKIKNFFLSISKN